MERFNASIFFDNRLFAQDIEGSLAHALMLKKIGLLTAAEHQKIATGLKKIFKEIQTGKFTFSEKQEDIHMAIESRLCELIGPLGGKLHTARSRNDQVALDIRLYIRENNSTLYKKIHQLKKAFVSLAKKNMNTVLPGYTHLQRAQPVLLSHHLLAYFEMLSRDSSRVADNQKRLDECPLGASALAGTPIGIDRKHVAKTLKFSDITHNSLDTVSDRDFLLDLLSTTSILMMHLSRFAEELILWNSQEFNFVVLPQEFCTGSSIMPQKVNPDAPELIRGKAGRVFGNLMSLLTTMKSLPLAYNKDMQEDKEPVFDTLDTVHMCLDVLIAMVPKITFRGDKMLDATKEGFLLATDLADYLAQKGLPFRQAHEASGKAVQYAITHGTYLEDLNLKELQKFSKLIQDDVFDKLNIYNSVATRTSLGGTSIKQVKKETARAEKLLKTFQKI